VAEWFKAPQPPRGNGDQGCHRAIRDHRPAPV